VLLVLCVAQFMLVLDISVTNVALASIQSDLGFAVGDLQWIVTAYTLVFGSLLIFFGRAGDLFGRRRLFVAGLVVFSLASLLCGLAQEPWQLIAARALQGLGGAMLSPAALSLLVTTFAEGPERTKALGVWGSIAAGGAAAGMILGGILTDLAGWRWVFFVNVPVGVLALVGAVRAVPESKHAARTRLDVAGALAVTGGLVALVYGLTRVETAGLGAGVTLRWFALAAALLVAFVVVERRVAAPLVDFGLFRSRGVAGANLFSLLTTAVVVGQSFFLSLYLRNVLGYSPLRTGFALIPITLVVVAVATSMPRLLPRLGVRAVLTLAGLFQAGGMLLSARFAPGGSYLTDVLPAIVVAAVGLGLGFVGATIAATAGVAPQQQGLASGVLNTAQQVGGSVGLAVLATLAAGHSRDLLTDGAGQADALTGGFARGFVVAAAFALAAALAAVLLAPGRTATAAAAPPGEGGTTLHAAGAPAAVEGVAAAPVPPAPVPAAAPLTPAPATPVAVEEKP
jgi:EmrB/QacA subfamily drug resistance transporter